MRPRIRKVSGSGFRRGPVVDLAQRPAHQRGAVAVREAIRDPERVNALFVGQQVDGAGPVGAPHAAVDAEGADSDDPTVLRKGGALQPLGSYTETSSHKGYGLGIMVDILTGVLPGMGSAIFEGARMQGQWFAAWRIFG